MNGFEKRELPTSDERRRLEFYRKVIGGIVDLTRQGFGQSVIVAARQSNYFILVGVAAFCTALGAAEPDSITTRNGITYTNAAIQRADPDGVIVEYTPQPGSIGLAKLKFANLSDELRKHYNYNEADAVTFEQNQAAGIARRQEEIAQGEIEKQRRRDELLQQRAQAEAELEASRQAKAALAAGQMQMGGWYGGYYGDGDWYQIGQRRYRFNSRGPDTVNPHGVDSVDFNTGLGLGRGGLGPFGLLPGHASGESGHGGTFRGPAARDNRSGRSF